MKTLKCLVIILSLYSGASSTLSHAQARPIPNVSTGADGDFLPPAGITTLAARTFNFRRINIPNGATIKFTRNSSNSPVYFLAQGDVTIDGQIDLSGENGDTVRGGQGGPGAFDGGTPGTAGSQPGDGLGPGAGAGGTADGTIPGGDAAYGTAPLAGNPRDGQVYGTQLLIPLVGGSGGGGSAASPIFGGAIGGGGGGGAILIASSTRITHTGQILAWGGYSGARGSGSGGAVRLLAPVIEGSGQIQVYGFNTAEGHGRVRCDMVDRSNFHLSIQPPEAPQTLDQFLPLIFPPNVPTLRVVSVAGQAIPPNASTGFTVTLPLNSAETQPIVLEASGFHVRVPVAVKLTPVSGNAGPATTVDIPNDVSEPAQVVVNVAFPANIPTTVNVWTR